jgi:hypothetical protein
MQELICTERELYPSASGEGIKWRLRYAAPLNNESTKFRKLDVFPSSGEERETPTLLGSDSG